MAEYIRRMLRPLAGSRRATIDTIEPLTSPLSPRQPVDLTDDAAVTEVLDLAIKVGSVLLDSGTGAIDTQTQIRFVAGMFGVERADVDVTYNTIMVSARRGSSMPPVTAMRTVHYRSLDFTRLAQVDRLIRKIRSLAVTPGEAHEVSSVQDAITGAPITGVARFFELLILTGGIISGVSVALRLLEGTGTYLPTITSTTTLGLTDAPAQIIGGGVAAAAFALGSYAETRALTVAFAGGLIGAMVSAAAALIDIGAVIAGGLAAVTVGFVGGLLARRALTPPLVVAVAGITPLLPGLAVYRGLYGFLNEQTLDGFTALASALGIGAALAAGVTLGEFLARTLRRPRIPTRPTRALLTARSALRPKRFTRDADDPPPVPDDVAVTEPMRALRADSGSFARITADDLTARADR
ncbi:MAG: threonine/serine exporter family protein [Corynebacteriales bacterium]|nr:threonine/serine exporter family protein [Mycobacteriales bacterium]